MKVIIAGSRTLRDYELLKRHCDFILQNTSEVEIVSGGQVSRDSATGEKFGADYLGEQYAKEKGYKLKRFPADWKAFGKRAGYIRNKQMAEYADALIAFPLPNSSGTNMMIELAKEARLKVSILKLSIS